jgi:Ala-tRNA(Pro) deacylase
MKVQEYLQQEHVAFQVLEHPPAYTAQEVAAEEHVSGNRTAKAVVVKADSDFAVCVLPASFKLDLGKVARAMKVRQVRLADESEMARIFPDVEVGAEPPFGNLYNLPTLVDQNLVHEEDILFSAGTHRHAIRMKYGDFARLAQPRVADLAVHL